MLLYENLYFACSVLEELRLRTAAAFNHSFYGNYTVASLQCSRLISFVAGSLPRFPREGTCGEGNKAPALEAAQLQPVA